MKYRLGSKCVSGHRRWRLSQRFADQTLRSVEHICIGGAPSGYDFCFRILCSQVQPAQRATHIKASLTKLLSQTGFPNPGFFLSWQLRPVRDVRNRRYRGATIERAKSREIVVWRTKSWPVVAGSATPLNLLIRKRCFPIGEQPSWPSHALIARRKPLFVRNPTRLECGLGNFRYRRRKHPISAKRLPKRESVLRPHAQKLRFAQRLRATSLN